MTTILGDVRAILKAETDFTDLVDEVYVLAFPANPTMPVAVLRTISGYSDLVSAESGDNEMTTRLQLDIWADTFSETQAIKEVVVPMFRKNRYPAYGILRTRIDLTFDLYENETTLYRQTIDISITHEGA